MGKKHIELVWEIKTMHIKYEMLYRTGMGNNMKAPIFSDKILIQKIKMDERVLQN